MDLENIDTRVLLSSCATLVFLGLAIRLYAALVLQPKKQRSNLRKQGITGPPPVFLLGNILEIKKARDALAKRAPSSEVPVSHDPATLLLPFLNNWRKQYGSVFVFSLGNSQILGVTDPDVIKDLVTCVSLDLGKPSYQQKDRGPLLGHGILTSNGTAWAKQRKIIAPELYMPKIKGMMTLITESSVALVNSWNKEIEKHGGTADIKIDGDMRCFSGDVIARACFGSNYTSGQEIFFKLRSLMELMSKKSLIIGIPGMRYIPTKANREAWALEKEVRNLILEVVKERQKTAREEKDLLQMVLESSQNSDFCQEETDRFIVDNCKNVYSAGYETTAITASWCLMLLASNLEWQERVRAEVHEVCGGQIPDFDMLRKLKQLTMVIHESLRLYPPVPVLSREAFVDIKLGNVNVPKGVNVWAMVLTLHTDPEVWGEDAYRFKPERFANGSTGACKLPHLYMPFGVGPRVCLGQNLAMVELKILIALIVSNFSFTLSPKYKHSPAIKLLVEPEYGVDLLLRKL